METFNLFILDFESGIPTKYIVEKEFQEEEKLEEFITKKGHSLSSCEWMITKEELVIND